MYMHNLELLYLEFRPILNEILKKDIDFTKDASEIELKLFKDWVDKNMHELVSDPKIVHNFQLNKLIGKARESLNTKKNVSFHCRLDLISALKKLKK